ncbi:MAG: GNAT family N-acetyltransferase [Phycisphaeraceae bacterium]|nr:GNAT family N-acetyltransferase [Phycisphaeraceae bacterium]
MTPSDFAIRRVEPTDFDAIIEMCRTVYPKETPYTREELGDHVRVFPRGQFVAVEKASARVAGVHFTLQLHIRDFHIDDSWDVLTDRGTFLDHNPEGHTLYGADIMVHPSFQHHGLARVLTEAAKTLVEEMGLWRMVGASRLPGFGKVAATTDIGAYVNDVIAGKQFDPVLSIHLKDGWKAIRPIHGYLQHDEESANWAEVIQWINPQRPKLSGDELLQSGWDLPR